MKRAVILAGGRGSRLAPYTAVLPKPLLPLGDRAIVDIVVGQLSARGWDEVVMSVGHLAHLVRAVLGDGSRHGLPVRYHEEAEPLGTAAPLREIEGLDGTFLTMNGDVLTDLDYDRLLDVHREAGNLLTIATHRRDVPTDYGVLQLDGDAASPRVTAHVMPVLLRDADRRDAVRRAMLERHGVQTSVLYPALHEFSAYRAEGREPLPRSERAARAQLTLPIYPHLGEERQDLVIEALRAALATE